jgi:FtsP/CotA-like multicopper oxidase with cupredoxin domain
MDSHHPQFAYTDMPQADYPSLSADPSRRRFLQGTLASAAALGNIGAAALAHAQTGLQRSTLSHYHLAATDKTVHWGYFSKSLKPLVEVESGDFVTIETVTHHTSDDYERMIKSDPGVESSTTGTSAGKALTGAAPARAWGCTSVPDR